MAIACFLGKTAIIKVLMESNVGALSGLVFPIPCLRNQSIRYASIRWDDELKRSRKKAQKLALNDEKDLAKDMKEATSIAESYTSYSSEEYAPWSNEFKDNGNIMGEIIEFLLGFVKILILFLVFLVRNRCGCFFTKILLSK
jgi:hypothetical protein